MSILRILFGQGTWGAGGNLVAWVICGIPATLLALWHHRRQVHARFDRLEQMITRRPSEDLEKPGTDGGPG